MRAIILAAGRGSRMGGATDQQPKCLTKLGGKSLLAWEIEALRDAGIDSVAVVRGYMSDQLVIADIETFENPRWAETNMVASLACASAWLSSDVCIVSYSDIVYPSSPIKALTSTKCDIAVTYYVNWRNLWEERFTNPLADAETFRIDTSGRLLEIGQRANSLDEIQGQYMGLLRFTPSGWNNVESLLQRIDPTERDRLDMTSLLQLLISNGTAVGAIPISAPWYEVDSQADLQLYERRAAANGGLLW